MEIVGFVQCSIIKWNQKAVLELDSALNEWIDALPDFCNYAIQLKDTVLAHQSVMLHAGFYWAQIQVHKQFMSWPGQKSALTIHSLAICANAAHSCVHLLDHHQQYK
ncbi:hypothetical protein GYMLUDRAFT_1017942, partial [Collybiopsis luxurians FD-317 M1]